MSTPDKYEHPVPSRCSHCHQQLESPIACSACGALGQTPPDSFDCFELFGLEPAYDLDLAVLRHKYLSLSRVLHPDIAGQNSPEQRQQALILSAEFNRAYETLRDPLSRAEYLLALNGGPSTSEDKSVPANLLSQVLMLQEEIEEAQSADDLETLKEINAQVRQKQAAALDTIGKLARQLGANDAEIARKLREQLNTIRYWNTIQEKIPAEAGGAE